MGKEGTFFLVFKVILKLALLAFPVNLSKLSKMHPVQCVATKLMYLVLHSQRWEVLVGAIFTIFPDPRDF